MVAVCVTARPIPYLWVSITSVQSACSSEVFASRLTCIASSPYSVHPQHNWSWRYRTVDAHVFVNGSPELMDEVQLFLNDARGTLSVSGTSVANTCMCVYMNGLSLSCFY